SGIYETLKSYVRNRAHHEGSIDNVNKGCHIVLKTKPQELYENPAEEEGEDDCNPIEKDL
ncbi:hypothetical protein Dimus_036208, partial [Dionaea muscipula]